MALTHRDLKLIGKEIQKSENRLLKLLEEKILPKFKVEIMDEMLLLMMTHFTSKHEFRHEVDRIDNRLADMNDRLTQVQDTAVRVADNHEERLVFLEAKVR